MSSVNSKKTYNQHLQDLIDEYRETHGGTFILDDIVNWAFDREKHDLIRSSARKELRRNLNKAARKRMIKDSQNRIVRMYHSASQQVVDENGNFIIKAVWGHIFEMSFDHAAMSFIEGRRAQLSGGCKRLKADVDSFNDNNPNAQTDKIQIQFDFSYDVEPDGFDDGPNDLPKKKKK